MVRKSAKEAIPEEPMLDVGEASSNSAHALWDKGFFPDHDLPPFKGKASRQNPTKPSRPLLQSAATDPKPLELEVLFGATRPFLQSSGGGRKRLDPLVERIWTRPFLQSCGLWYSDTPA